jgi:hypothetical protein
VHAGGEKTQEEEEGGNSESKEDGPGPPSLECTFLLYLSFVLPFI